MQKSSNQAIDNSNELEKLKNLKKSIALGKKISETEAESYYDVLELVGGFNLSYEDGICALCSEDGKKLTKEQSIQALNKLISDYQPPKINPPEQKGATSVVIHCSNDGPVEPKTEIPQTASGDLKTMSLIEAIKQNNQEEFFRLVNLKTAPLGKRFVDGVDTEYEGSPLYWAARCGYVHFINPLVKAGVGVTKPDKHGKTAVYVAACNGHVEAIAALKAAGANVDTPNNDGETPVYAAACNRQAEAIRALKALGANVDTPDNNSWTPVFVVAQRGYAEIITLLKAMGANVDTPNNDGTTPIYATAQKGYVAAMNALLASGADASIRTKRGTPLEIASTTPDDEEEYLEIVRLLEGHFKQYPSGVKPVSLIEAIKQNNEEEFFRLLNLKTDPLGKRFIDEVDTEYEGSPLYWTAFYGYMHFINPLLKVGADVSKPDKYGATPVYIAAQEGHVEAITALKTAGANVDTPMGDGRTPVYAAACEGHAEAITVLKAAGANVDTADEEGTTPVYIAAHNGHAVAITALKAAGANVDTPMNDGRTPVYIAASNGHAEAIAVLKAAGANVDTPDNDGWTPVYIAAQNGHASAIAALKTAGANVDTPKPDGATPVYIAAARGHAEAIAALKAAGASMDTPRNNGETPVYIAVKKAYLPVITALLEAGADASVETPEGTALDCAKQGKEAAHPEIVRLLEAHFKQYPNGIKPISTVKQEVALPAKPFSPPEQRSPQTGILTQFKETFKPVPKMNASDSKELGEFLGLVAEGEQEKAEAMLKENPSLALLAEEVTDLSKRTFRGITGFQYAVWALDWRMWTMIKKYLPNEEAKRQAQVFETGSWVQTHGIHANLNMLMKAYETTVALYEQSKWAEGDKAWVQQVGGAQRLLPAHVVNEYCSQRYTFSSETSFTDISMLRSRNIDAGEWFTASYDDGKLGEKFAIITVGNSVCAAKKRACQRALIQPGVEGPSGGLAFVKSDLEGVRVLNRVRIAQRDELVSELKPKVQSKVAC